jgi:CheY-like chemotaxis protein
MSSKKPIRLLLVDDDKDDQEIFSIALDDLGEEIDCRYANDGIQALEMLGKPGTELPEIIFIDMNMPRMNGLQCLAEIKKNPVLGKIQAYMYSTSADEKSIETARNYGALDFIIKPASISELSEILRELFENLNNRAYVE